MVEQRPDRSLPMSAPSAESLSRSLRTRTTFWRLERLAASLRTGAGWSAGFSSFREHSIRIVSPPRTR